MKEFDDGGREVTIKGLSKLYVGDGNPPVEKEIKLKDGRTMDGVNRNGYTYRLTFVDHEAGDKARTLNVMYDDFFKGLVESRARSGLRGILQRTNEDGKWKWTFNANQIQTGATSPREGATK